jgi:hypothetical protein
MPGLALRRARYADEAGGASFSPRDRRALRRLHPQAQALTGDYYRIPPWAWHQTPYDVLTARDPDARLAPLGGVLAVLDRCAYNRREEASGQEQTLYRVSLQDASILRVAERDSRLDLEALLLYVLTHELVHIIRFHTALKDFDAVGDRDSEESRVHAVTFQILKGIPDRRIRFILERYEPDRRSFLGVS